MSGSSRQLTLKKGAPGLEVIKHEYSLKLKIKCNDWLLADIALYFESENELKFYNLKARRSGVRSAMRAASHLPGRGPTDVDDATAPVL